jgi:hypothetical protein
MAACPAAVFASWRLQRLGDFNSCCVLGIKRGKNRLNLSVKGGVDAVTALTAFLNEADGDAELENGRKRTVSGLTLRRILRRHGRVADDSEVGAEGTMDTFALITHAPPPASISTKARGYRSPACDLCGLGRSGCRLTRWLCSRPQARWTPIR